MKNKTPLMLGGAFLLLLVIFLFTSLHPREVTEGARPLFKGKIPVIDKIEVQNPKGDTVVLEKKNEVWNITKPITYKASPRVMTEIIDGFGGVMIDDAVTSDPNEKGRFGVEDSTAIRLIVSGGGKSVLDVLIGRYSPDLSHTYVRKHGSDDIELWRGIFARLMNRDLDEWRDKTVYSFNSGDITGVTVTEGKTTRRLALADSLWTFTENGQGKPVNQGKANEFVTFIAMLLCDSFATDDDIPRAASTAPDTKVSFTVRNGDTHTSDLWTPKKDSDAKRTLLRKENGDILFRFYESNGDQLRMLYDKMK